jgi:hypothetical protein
MKREQVKALVEAHDHIQKAFQLYMVNIPIETGIKLNRIADIEFEKHLLLLNTKFIELLHKLGEIPLELSDELDSAYGNNDVAAILKIEQKIERWINNNECN